MYKAFGKKLIDPALMKEAKKVLADVANQRKMAMVRIWRLFKPHAHRWVAGTLILMVTECLWGFLEGNLVALTQLAYDLKPDTLQRTARWIGMVAAGYLFNWCGKRPSFKSHFLKCENDQFTKTGSGPT